MATLWVCAELDFVNREEVCGHAFWHRLNCANPILGTRWNNALFACDQRDNGRATHGHDFVIDLTGQQAQGQADHASTVAKHTFDGVVRLAGVGWTEHRCDALLLGHVGKTLLLAQSGGA